MIIGIQESISPYSQRNLTLNYSMGGEIDLEEIGSKKFKDCDV